MLYEWHTSRAADCLGGMLDEFSGTVQCDGYAAYASYVKDRSDINLAACWAHARRKFHDALDECPGQARWILNQIGHMYRIERGLRGRSPQRRQAVRASETAMVLVRLEAIGTLLPATSCSNIWAGL